MKFKRTTVTVEIIAGILAMGIYVDQLIRLRRENGVALFLFWFIPALFLILTAIIARKGKTWAKWLHILAIPIMVFLFLGSFFSLSNIAQHKKWDKEAAEYKASHVPVHCSDLPCIINNCEYVFHDDNENAFKLLNAQLQNANRCQDPNEMKKFLDVIACTEYTKKDGTSVFNAELSEYFGEEVEIDFAERPECLLNGVLLADKAIQKRVMGMGASPHMTEDLQGKTKANFEKYRSVKKYFGLYEAD